MPVTADYVRKTADERFWTKVGLVPHSGCWLWVGRKNEHGYGTFWNGTKHRGHNVNVLAHRWAFERFRDPIPKGKCVLHKCDQPSCVNPWHLFLGTQADNVADCVARGRRNQSRINKLTPEQRREIAEAYVSGVGSQSYLARLYGVSQPTVSHIVRMHYPEHYPLDWKERR